MASVAVAVDFTTLTDQRMAHIGLDRGEETFLKNVEAGFTNGDSLAIRIGAIDNLRWHEHASRLIGGPDAERFVPVISNENGKLASALVHHMDSIAAYQLFGEDVPEGNQRYTGAVYYVARVKTANNGWMVRIYVGAASGVQGHFDQAAVYTAITTAAALWALKMIALYGKG